MISITRQAAVAPLQCRSHAVRWVSGNASSAAGRDMTAWLPWIDEALGVE